MSAAIQKNGTLAAEVRRSCFDGSTLQLIGWRLLAGLVTVLTLGIAYPWAMCMTVRWETKHTVINGRRLRFTGKGIGLLGKYLLGCLLTVLTLGIYGIWFSLTIKKWQVKHTVYESDPEPVDSRFTGGAGGWLGIHILWVLQTVFTLGIGYTWGQKRVLKWEAEHTYIGGSPLAFDGTGLQLLGKYLLWGLLTVVTLGVFALFLPVRYLKWKISHTQALSATGSYYQKSREHEETALRDVVKFIQADNDTQLERVKNGITGEETEEALAALAEEGCRSAMYELALRKKEESFAGESLEYLRGAALAGYHPAMLDYAVFTGTEQPALYGQLLEGCAEHGNPHAPWLLKQHYERHAELLHEQGSYDCTEVLQKAAYWFKVAMERGDAEALENKDQYEKLVRKLAQWLTERRERKTDRGGGMVALMVAVALIASVGCFVVWRMFLVKPAENTQPDHLGAVQIYCDGGQVEADTALFQSVPWEPSVVSYENFEIINNSDTRRSCTLELVSTAAEDAVLAILITGKVSQGDMERVMAQRDSFVPLKDFSGEISLAPWETAHVAVILYWPGRDGAYVPEGMVLPAQLDIRTVFTWE